MDIKPYFDCWHETQQRSQTGAEKIQGGTMRNVWWNKDPSETPQGWATHEQPKIKRDDCLSILSCEDTLFDWELGTGKCETGEMQDLQGIVPASENAQGEIMWQAGMPKGKREIVGRVAVGVKNRVDRLKAIGNGQIPAVAKLAWEILTQKT